MRGLNLKSKQQGVFSIEMAIIGVVFSLLLVFSGDVIIKLSVKGKLDRLSYSLVNIIKERTELYAVDSKITANEVDAIYSIANNSLARTMGSFDATKLKILVEEQTFSGINTPNRAVRLPLGKPVCAVPQFLSQLTNLSVVSSWGRQVSLYRVTLCYDTDNWIGSKLGIDFTTVTSSSVMIGR